jgi:hypothetical protein
VQYAPDPPKTVYCSRHTPRHVPGSPAGSFARCRLLLEATYCAARRRRRRRLSCSAFASLSLAARFAKSRRHHLRLRRVSIGKRLCPRGRQSGATAGRRDSESAVSDTDIAIASAEAMVTLTLGESTARDDRRRPLPAEVVVTPARGESAASAAKRTLSRRAGVTAASARRVRLRRRKAAAPKPTRGQRHRATSACDAVRGRQF